MLVLDVVQVPPAAMAEDPQLPAEHADIAREDVIKILVRARREREREKQRAL